MYTHFKFFAKPGYSDVISTRIDDKLFYFASDEILFKIVRFFPLELVPCNEFAINYRSVRITAILLQNLKCRAKFFESNTILVET